MLRHCDNCTGTRNPPHRPDAAGGTLQPTPVAGWAVLYLNIETVGKKRFCARFRASKDDFVIAGSTPRKACRAWFASAGAPVHSGVGKRSLAWVVVAHTAPAQRHGQDAPGNEPGARTATYIPVINRRRSPRWQAERLITECARMARGRYSAITGLRKVPIPPTVMSMVSPGRRNTGGCRLKPTPEGVPVIITVPGRSVAIREM